MLNARKKCSLPDSNSDGVDDFGNAPEHSGRLVWDSSRTPAFSTTCQVRACNAGYDYRDVNNDVLNVCTKTVAGYWSAANDKNRTACPLRAGNNAGKPDNDKSEWLVADGDEPCQ